MLVWKREWREDVVIFIAKPVVLFLYLDWFTFVPGLSIFTSAPDVRHR